MHMTPKQLNKRRTALQRVALRVAYRDGFFSSLGEPLTIRLVEPLDLPMVKVGDEPEVRGDVLAWFVEKDEVVEYCEPKNGDCFDTRIENLTPIYYVLPTPPTKKTRHVPGVNWSVGIERWIVTKNRTIGAFYTQEEAVAALVAVGGEDTRKKRTRKKAEPITPDEVVRLGIVIPKGISFDKTRRRWVARKNSRFLGRFLDPRDAIEAVGGCAPPAPRPVEPRPPAIPKFKIIHRREDGGYEELFVNGEKWGNFNTPSEARAALRNHLYGVAP